VTEPTHAGSDAVRRASLAVYAVFILNGVNIATWAARLPAIRDGLHLTPDKMGLLLLVGSIGSLLALPTTGLVVPRLGTRGTVALFAVVDAVGLAIASFGVHTGRVLVVVLGLVVYGVGTSLWDSAMNLEGASVEQRLGRTIMPRYHAGFSFGTMIASGLAGLAAGVHAPVVVHVPVVVVLSSAAAIVATRFFLPDEPHRAASAPAAVSHAATPAPAPAHGRARAVLQAWLEPRTLLVGLVVLGAALTEGAANDWVSLAVVDGFDVGHAMGAFGFGVFVTAMTAMRWFGTRLLDRYGRVAVLRLCAALALGGLLVFCLAPTLWLALVGVVAWGVGAALGFPVGMSAASDDPAHAAARLSVISTIGYSAFLAGPPLLGLLADHVGYRHALLAVAVPVLLGLLFVRAAAPLKPAVGEPEPARPTLEQ
jgi:MFS family permease